MKTVSFQNDGVLDPVSIATFGINAKETDNPIGYFGTGLKYAIAVLLREGQEITILSRKDVYKFTKDSTMVRGKAFDVVCMNDTPLGFTTELGKNWEMWQAFREIYCNALDEKGFVKKGEIAHGHTKTTVIVNGDEFYQCYLDRATVILESEPDIEGGRCDVHAGSNDYIYFKGVRIYEPIRPTLYTYNIKHGIDITEDRTAKYEFQVMARISDAIVESTDKNMIHAAIMAERNVYYESRLDYGDVRGTPSKEFLDVAEANRLKPGFNQSAIELLARHRKLPPPDKIKLNNIQEKQIDKAVRFCEMIGYNIKSYPVVVTDQLKGGYMGLAENQTIFISLDTFGMGTKYLASTLIEEFLHLQTGYGDCTRELQNHLFNDIVSLGERVIGEPV